MSVFSGGFDLAMAEEVCGDPDGVVATSAVMDLLAQLVRQSIVVADFDGRFRQLQPMREYGLHRLQALGEEELTRQRHCAYVRRLAADAAKQCCSPIELDMLCKVQLELPNIRTALTQCNTPQRAETGLRIATDIFQVGFSFFSVFLNEICARLETFLALAATVPVPERINALAAVACMRLWEGDQDRAKVHQQECLDQARRLGATDADLPAISLLRGMQLFLAHSDPSCVEPLRQAREAFKTQNAQAETFKTGIWLAIAAGFLAPQDIAEKAVADCLADAEAHGGPWSMSWALWAQGRTTANQQRAITLLQEALRMMITIGDLQWDPSLCAESIAWEWAAQGLAHPAAQLLGGVIGRQQSTRIPAGPGPFQQARENAISSMRATIGHEAYAAAFCKGSMLSAEEVYTLALSPDPEETIPPTRDVPLELLTARQQDIARLVAQGMSNKGIAVRLHISQRTVENHLAQIFTRLDARNRAQVAAWITSQSNGNSWCPERRVE